MLVQSGGVLRIAGYSLTLVNTGLVSTGKVCVMPKCIYVRTRNNNNRSFGRYARRTFHTTVGTRRGRKTADVFPALSSSPFSRVHGTMAIYRALVGRGSDPILKLRMRNPCLGPGETNRRFTKGLGGPSGRRCASLLRDASYVGH